MKRLLAIALVIGVAAVTANAQLTLTPYQDQGWDYSNGFVRDLPCLYEENTNSGYYLPSSGNTYSDDIHLDPYAGSYTIQGFDVAYHSRTTAANAPFDMTVNFYEMATDYTYGPLIGTYTVTGLGTGSWLVYRELGVGEMTVAAGVSDIWMEVAFTPIDGTTGIQIAGDMVAEEGNPSADLFAAANPQGNFLGLSWFGGYTPLLPQSDPLWNPPGSFQMSLYGIPEPVTLGLVALGGLLAVRRRR